MIKKTVLPNSKREDILSLLDKTTGNIGIELGVAEGLFSRRLLDSGRFETLFGVDMYADWHDVEQYKRALTRCGLHAPYKLLRMKFDEALELFEDGTFDFIYVDGYASSGELGGQTIYDWFRKVKVGGVIAGDDYHDDWPLVKEAVDDFSARLGAELVLTEHQEDADYSRYPSWGLRKTTATTPAPKTDLIRRGLAAQKWQERRYAVKKLLMSFGLYKPATVPVPVKPDR